MTIYGWDMSHFDAPDARKAINEGFTFFTHKAGGDKDDAEIGQWWQYMSGYRGRALLGAYWVLYPGNPSGRADSFMARLDQTCPGWRDGPFILQVDAEQWNGDPGTVPSVAECNAFCDRLRAKMPKLEPIGYLPSWVYGSKLKDFRYPWWQSSYVGGSGAASSLYPGDSSSRWNAYAGKVPSILQFTSSATIAGQTTSDANAFRGTLSELTALVAPGWEQDVTLTSDEVTAIARAVWAFDPGWKNPADHSQGVWPGISDETFSPNANSNGTVAPGTAIQYLLRRQQSELPAILAAISALDNVDEIALAQALAPALHALIVADGPLTGLTGDEIEQRFRNVLIHGTENA